MKSLVLSVASTAFVLSWSAINSVVADDLPVPVMTVDWAQLKARGQILGGEVVPAEADQPARLKVTNTHPGNHSIPICELVAPPITSPSYAVRGRVRYDGVDGVGFLEMWSHFADRGRYFTRTMDSSGPMGTITGTTSERDFLLPFHTLGQTPPPEKLVINLVLNGPGTVELGPLELIPIADFTTAGSPGWWNGSMGGMIGGVGGSLVGLLGGLIGMLVGRGRAPGFVLTLAALIAGAGAVLLCAGFYATVTTQPFAVTYPLLLLGGIMSIYGTGVLYIAPGQFRAHELRRMQALDLN